MCKQFVFWMFSLVPQIQVGAAALVLIAVTLLVDFGGGVDGVALDDSVKILQPLELVVTLLLSVNPETTHTHAHTHTLIR